MLNKLIKHEFKATWKYFLAINVAALILGLIAGLIGYNVAGNYDDLPTTVVVLLWLSLVGYLFALAAAAILTTICNVVRYYRSLYTAQGYLTFTLPATTTEILSAKMIVAFIWQILMSICIVLSLMFLAGGFMIYGLQNNPEDILEFFDDFFSGFSDLMGIVGVAGVIRYIFNMILSIMVSLMMYFFAISIGQLWQKHKILGSVLAFFGIRFLYGTASSIISLLTGSFRLMIVESSDPGKFFSHTTIVSLVISLVAIIGMYIGSILITDKKLNLD